MIAITPEIFTFRFFLKRPISVNHTLFEMHYLTCISGKNFLKPATLCLLLRYCVDILLIENYKRLIDPSKKKIRNNHAWNFPVTLVYMYAVNVFP